MGRRKTPVKAVAYLRTSSASHVDGDSPIRQRRSIRGFAEANDYELVKEFYDEAVSGTDPIDQRPGFAEMLAYLAGNGAKVIIIESPDRFARDLLVQLAGHDALRREGYALVPASAPDFFTEDTPTAKLVRSVLGAIAEFDRANIVAKLAGARKRVRERDGKCEGRKSNNELYPEAVALARQLRRKPRNGKRLSFQAISDQLAAEGFRNERDQPFHPFKISQMLAYRDDAPSTAPVVESRKPRPAVVTMPAATDKAPAAVAVPAPALQPVEFPPVRFSPAAIAAGTAAAMKTARTRLRPIVKVLQALSERPAGTIRNDALAEQAAKLRSVADLLRAFVPATFIAELRAGAEELERLAARPAGTIPGPSIAREVNKVRKMIAPGATAA